MSSHYTDTFSIRSQERGDSLSLSFCQYGEHMEKGLRSYLHADEILTFKTFLYEKRKKNYLLGRYAAKLALAHLLNENDLSRISIMNGIFNQPLVDYSGRIPFQVSFAHSNDLATAIAFPDWLILGLDLEEVTEQTRLTTEKELTAHEKMIASALFPLREHLVMLWTAKESLSKVLKTGLTLPLHLLEIKHIEAQKDCFGCTFVNFFQYQCLSWVAGGYAFSITYPKNTQVELDISHIQQQLHGLSIHAPQLSY